MSLQTHAKQGLHRPTFTTPYAVPKTKRQMLEATVRLGDCIIKTAPYGSPDWMTNATAENEFEVIDALAQVKGFFEVPDSARGKPEQITAMIEAHFDSRALRLGYRQWMV